MGAFILTMALILIIIISFICTTEADERDARAISAIFLATASCALAITIAKMAIKNNAVNQGYIKHSGNLYSVTKVAPLENPEVKTFIETKGKTQ